jgi:transposase-like protein
MHNAETMTKSISTHLFTSDDVRRDFPADFLDETTCRLWILKRLHPEGPHCPACGLSVHDRFEHRFWMCARLRCPCGKYYTALTGTFLSGSQFSFAEIILLAMFFSLRVSDGEIADILDISADNVRLWRHKFEGNKKLVDGQGIL